MIDKATDESIRRAATIIRQGGLVAFPTETVYGLGVNALDQEAVKRLFGVKERPFASPLIVHVSDEEMARTVTAEWPPLAHKLARCFWPGPLTMVIRKAAIVPDLVTAGLDSVGVRVPAHAVALALIRRAGVPIAAPSANRFTELSPTTAEHVQAGLGDRIEMILDAGQTQVGIESTVVSLRRDQPTILRPGMISQSELEAVTRVRWEREVDLPHIKEGAESPGQHPRHYAPRTPFYVLEFGAPKPSGRGRVLSMPQDRDAYAASLYSVLHQADAEGLDWIAVEKPPETPEWAGILDRLRRASTSRE
ncbi:MAG: threonylcarbamoyl-AMP synthase [Acidobacteriaceae bacterium]|nr:threonylcarbamoyl-AMP synthase [Acidobacteriaceae bacterium]